jgi:hypothetical protein
MRKTRAQGKQTKAQLAADFTKLLQTKFSDSINLHVNLYSSCLNPSKIRTSLAQALGMLYCDVAVKADIPKELAVWQLANMFDLRVKKDLPHD